MEIPQFDIDVFAIIFDELQPNLDELQTTLDELQPTLDKLEPNLDELQPTLDELQPTLDELQPTLDELQPTLDELQPALDELQPTLDKLEPTLDELQPEILPLPPAQEENQQNQQLPLPSHHMIFQDNEEYQIFQQLSHQEANQLQDQIQHEQLYKDQLLDQVQMDKCKHLDTVIPRFIFIIFKRYHMICIAKRHYLYSIIAFKKPF